MCKLEHYFITEPAVAKGRFSCGYVIHSVLSMHTVSGVEGDSLKMGSSLLGRCPILLPPRV